MISQLPIHAGEPIRLFLLERNAYEELKGGGFCSHNDVFKPLSYALRGVYDDYGSIEKVEESETSDLLLTYFKNITEESSLINTDKRDKVTADEITVDYLTREVERGHLYHIKKTDLETYITDMLGKEKDYDKQEKLGDEMRRYSAKEKGVFAAVMIREDVYQLAISSVLKAKNWRGENCADIVDAQIKKFIEARQTILGITDPHDKMLAVLRLSDDTKLFGGFSTEHLSFRFYSEIISRLIDPAEVIDGREEKLMAVVAKTKEYMAFTWFLSMTRKAWMPQSGAGSQQGWYGDDFTAFNDFYNGMPELIKSVRSKMEVEEDL